jgi:prolipoprotein diacylglyceryl transferase
MGIIISLWLFNRRYKLGLWYLLDQIALVVPLAGAFIRLGNLMNSEIIGKPTDLPWAFIFRKEDGLPRHPSQLYEAIAYLIIFTLMYLAMRRRKMPDGFQFGLLLSLMFGFRFVIEFTKEIQSTFEATLPLDMGQILSIPFIVLGLIIMYLKAKSSTGPHG